MSDAHAVLVDVSSGDHGSHATQGHGSIATSQVNDDDADGLGVGQGGRSSSRSSHGDFVLCIQVKTFAGEDA